MTKLMRLIFAVLTLAIAPVSYGESVPVLPEGNMPISREVQALLSRRDDMADMRAEAAYTLGVEIARHWGISLDGKESYDELDRKIRAERTVRERLQREHETRMSRSVQCLVPGVGNYVPTGTSVCMADIVAAQCPSCRAGFIHICERTGQGADAAGVWRLVEACDNQTRQSLGGELGVSDSTITRDAPVQSQSGGSLECEALMANIASIGQQMDPNNPDPAYRQIMQICGGNPQRCVERMQQCASEL